MNCQICNAEMDTTGINPYRTHCNACNEAVRKRVLHKKAREARKAKADAMDSIGMRKVRGAMGGTYWE